MNACRLPSVSVNRARFRQQRRQACDRVTATGSDLDDEPLAAGRGDPADGGQPGLVDGVHLSHEQSLSDVGDRPDLLVVQAGADTQPGPPHQPPEGLVELLGLYRC